MAYRNKSFCDLKILILLITICFSIIFTTTDAAAERSEKEISGTGWNLYLDSSASWQNDKLFLPPVDIKSVPVNPPSCGWDKLDESSDKKISVPGTVEGYFWSIPRDSAEMTGDYKGVSWWSTKFEVAPSQKGKRITLAFESVNLRAEVFVNQKLSGYDLIGNTPFEVDITDAVDFGKPNRLDVRITDPGGTFSWDDEKALKWGDYLIPSVHGFGGISGRVFLRATDEVHIDDIYVQNQKDPKRAKIFVNLGNISGDMVTGNLRIDIQKLNNPKKIIWSKIETVSLSPGSYDAIFEVKLDNAELWSINNPHLYTATVSFASSNKKINDSKEQRFGFRFFNVGEKNGDKRLYLNGERVFIISAMSRGFWPKMGMFPIPGMAERDMKMVKEFGYNMMMFHRAIGQVPVFDLADENGILTYEEPGGYQCLPAPNEFNQAWRKEKLRRMVIRDRSRPSLTNWNMDDWSYSPPNKWDFENMAMIHKLDPSRITTFNCISIAKAKNIVENPFKLHMLPFDDSLHYKGWLDPYHFAAQDGYIDEYYKNPRNYARLLLDKDLYTLGDSTDVVPSDEIYFLGEEGAFGTVLNLQDIKGDLDTLGAHGWMDGEYLKWYNAYNRFLDESGMRKAYPTVKDLTMSMGRNLHYFHGRIIENTRIMNTADAYILNGWAGGDTNTDIVDTYRHSTADMSILSHYNQPLYIAVKLRNKVLPTGSKPIADIFIVNEKNLTGSQTLKLIFKDPGGKEIFTKQFNVNILGGEEFGQLLTEGVLLPETAQNGYYTLEAELTDKNGKKTASGFDDLFAADFKSGYKIPENISVIDSSGIIKSFIESEFGKKLTDFDATRKPENIIIGMHDLTLAGSPEILDLVKNGATLIVLDNASLWINALPGIIPLKVNDKKTGDGHGRLFAGNHEFLRGLPQAQAFNWEYQTLYRSDKGGLKIEPKGIETIVAHARNNTDVFTVPLCVVAFGRGKVILSTLNILQPLGSQKPDASVAKKLFMNMIAP